MKNEPVFLTDKNHNIVLEALSPAPNAALPDSCKPFEILDQQPLKAQRKNIFR